MSDIDISVVIRTHNSGRTIKKALKECRNQILPPGMTMETIVVDHESTDKTLEIAQMYAGRLFSYSELRPNGGYTPGASLNAGIREARGSLIIIMSSHCFPADRHAFAHFISAAAEYANMCAGMNKRMDLAGIYGRQLPGKNLTPMQKVELHSVFPNEWQAQGMSPKFYNGFSAILKSAWEVMPFNEELTTYEDWDWAQRILVETGGRLLYAPAASVIRMTPFYHPENAEAQLAVIERDWMNEEAE